jgi:hypothetical protein
MAVAFLKALLLVPIQLVDVVFSLLFWLVRFVGRIAGVSWCQPVRTGEDYELFVAGYLRRQGFRKVEHTGRTGDLGVDLVAKKGFRTYAVQCKYYSHPVDGSAIQQVVAGMACYGCNAGLVVTNNDLTPGAWTLAEQNGVEVLTGISPASDPGSLSLEKLITPTRLTGFAVGCVLSGVAVSRLLKAGVILPPAGWIGVVLGCFVLSGVAVTLCRRIWAGIWE